MDRNTYLPQITETLGALARTPSPTGMTHLVEQLLMERLNAMGHKPWQSNKGAVYCKLNSQEGDGILLTAHIDTLGLMVRAVKDNGRLRVTQLGGYPMPYAEQENVTVFTRDGKQVAGTLRMNQPAAHANKELSSAQRSDENMEVVLDERVAAKEETEKLGIRAGDFIALDPRFTKSGDGFIKSRHLDDKASASVLVTLAKAFSEGAVTCSRPVYLLFSNYEEVGHGAVGGHPANITDMLAVDMGVVGDDLQTNEYKVSICAKDSAGPYHRGLTTALADLAEKNGLGYAVDIYPFYASDTSAALSAGHDYRHALIGPGVAASHGYERVHEDGLWNTFRLLEAWLTSF